jgi:hypothetical protein
MSPAAASSCSGTLLLCRTRSGIPCVSVSIVILTVECLSNPEPVLTSTRLAFRKKYVAVPEARQVARFAIFAVSGRDDSNKPQRKSH